MLIESPVPEYEIFIGGMLICENSWRLAEEIDEATICTIWWY